MADSCSETESAWIERISRHEHRACEQLLHELDSTLRAQVRKARRRYAAYGCGETAAEEADMLQELRLVLWMEAPRLAAAWDSSFGLSVQAFFALAAERRLCSILRARRRHGVCERPTDSALFSDLREPRDAENQQLAREELTLVLRGLRDRVSARAFDLFQVVVFEQLPVSEACSAFETTEACVYASVSRVRATAREVRRLISGTGRQRQCPRE